MAVSDIYNSLTFGGVNSLDYGIYISGPGVYDAPTRDVEFVSVPGRNGAIEIDKGHWNNIEVTYHAGVFAGNQEDFGKKINAFRNAIVSQIGYQRITDTYNPEEYRLGIYASGLSVNPVNRNEAGEFDLVFNCKPQRYLLEGEDEISVSSGDTITNPTLYDAGPLLSIEGNGLIEFDGQKIDISEGYLGNIVLATSIRQNSTIEFENINIQLEPYPMETGDSITMGSCKLAWRPDASGIPDAYMRDVTITSESETGVSSIVDKIELPGGTPILNGVFTQTPIINFEFGTARTFTNTTTFSGVYRRSGSDVSFSNAQVVTNISYDGDRSITISHSFSNVPSGITIEYKSITLLVDVYTGIVEGFSTHSFLGHPTYIDCESGTAYAITGGEIMSLDKYIVLPSDLPKLRPSENEITFENTITDLKITPRWWEL